MSCEASNRGTV